MKIKTSELEGVALDWAVANAEGLQLVRSHDHFRKIASPVWSEEKIAGQLAKMANGWMYVNTVGNAASYPAYSQFCAAGGPIIEREGISVVRADDDYGVDQDGFCNNEIIPVWAATVGHHSIETSTEHQSHEPMFQINQTEVQYGQTPLVAAMRAYVASKLGAELEIPDELTDSADGFTKI